MMHRFAQWLESLTGWRRWLAAFFSGAFATLTMPPYDFWLAGFVSFPILVWLIDGVIAQSPITLTWKRIRTAAWLGWWFGFGYFVAGLWWIGSAMLVDAEEFAWALPLAVLGLPALLAVFYAVATLLASLIWKPGFLRIITLAVAFAFVEWLRTFLFTGFPWNAIGYAAMTTPLLMQSVTLVGLVGMNAVAVYVFASPALLSGGRSASLGLGLAVLLVAGHVGYGAWVLSNAPSMGANHSGLSVRIVQPSIAQNLKFDDQYRRSIFDKYIEMTKSPAAPGKPEPQIIIWPETAVPYILSSTPQALALIGETLKPGQILLAGSVREVKSPTDGELLYFNSILIINDSGEVVGSIDKVHLVPFGEYLPFDSFFRWIGIREMVQMPGGFTAADKRAVLTVNNDINFLPLICYEAIFPSELNIAGKPKLNAILNVTNDAWFGDTPGPYQHFRQAQLRAVEQRLPLIRAGNNGVSAVIDRYGRIIEQLKLNEVGTIDVYLPSTSAPKWGTS